MAGNFYYPDLNNLIAIRHIAFPNTTNKRRNNMEDNEFKMRKEEMLLKIEGTLEETNKLIVMLIKLKFNLRNCKTYKDYLRYYPDGFDIEEGLNHIRIFW